MSELTPLALTYKLVSVASILQAAEMLALRRHWSDSGEWSWSILRDDFRLARQLFDLLLNARSFTLLLVLQVLSAAFVLIVQPQSLALFFMTLGAALTSIRWRGTFNGGADGLTLLTLLALTVGSLNPNLAHACAIFIVVEVTLSFVIAGSVKLRRSSWRSGAALAGFLAHSNYGTPEHLARFMQNRQLAFVAGWSVMIFEISFPLALVNHALATVYIAGAILFQTINVYAFGLNRFLFAWLATYPLVYGLSGVVL